MDKKSTKDIRFVIALYEKAKASNDPHNGEDRYEVGKLAGLQPKAVNAIVKMLVQANFIRKKGEEKVYLTDHGINLARSIIDD